MKVYHGTTAALVDTIAKHGLWDWKNQQPAWVTASLNEAVFFAGLRALEDEKGGTPAVVAVDVPEKNLVSVGPLGLFAKQVVPVNCILSVMCPPLNVSSATQRRSLFYPGWMGINETAQFIQRADEADLAKFQELIDKGKFEEAWEMVEMSLNLPHHGLSPAKASLTLYAAVSRFADPVATGLSEHETLTDSIGMAASHRGYQVAIVKVPPSLVEDVPSDDGSEASFFVPKAAISPLFVRAVYNPWSRRSFKMSAFDVAFNLEELLSVVADKKELAVFRGLVNDCGEVHPRNIPAFVQRATPYLLSLMKRSSLAYPPEHLFGLLRKGAMVQDGYGNYSVQRYSSEQEKTLMLSVGDIVKDINTSIQGEVVAISKMHHEADIDIVVRWDQPINGQAIFEVHPNEIEFIRHKTEEEIMKDVDYRYYDESKSLKTRLDYGIRRAGRFYSKDDFTIAWDEYKSGLGLYRALGEMKESGGQTLFWAADNDGPDGGIQIIDPEEIKDGFVDFRTWLKENYDNADEMIADAEQVISEVAYGGLTRAKAEAPAGGGTTVGEPEAEEEPTEKEKGTGAVEPSTPPAGVPTRSEPDLNGSIMNDDGSECIPFREAYAVFMDGMKQWQIYVDYRDPTLKDLGRDYLEVEDYLNRRSLCETQTEQPS